MLLIKNHTSCALTACLAAASATIPRRVDRTLNLPVGIPEEPIGLQARPRAIHESRTPSPRMEHPGQNEGF